jgi:hypothetical protein
MSDFDQPAAERLLRTLGAADVPHVGGSLLDHVRRVTDLLDGWGAGPTVRAAALCHAVYGTDGFDTALLPVAERATLTAVIGPDAEALVYLYGSCDRHAVYPRLGDPGPVPFRDRFTGETHLPSEPEIRAFVELTAANELDVMAHSPELAARHGAGLHSLFTRARGRLSAEAWQACSALLPY